jgi:hypothetical protein
MRKNLLLSAAASFAALLLSGTSDPVSAQTRTTLDIYVVDVEGGNATLFVTPGECFFIDTGNTGPQVGADALRIMEAAKDAGLTQMITLSPTGMATTTGHWRSSQAHPDQAFHRPRPSSSRRPPR